MTDGPWERRIYKDLQDLLEEGEDGKLFVRTSEETLSEIRDQVMLNTLLEIRDAINLNNELLKGILQ